MSIYSNMPNSNFLFSETLKSNTISKNLLDVESFASEFLSQYPSATRVIEDGYDALKIPMSTNLLTLNLFDGFFIENTQYTFSLTAKCSLTSKNPRLVYYYSDGTFGGLIGYAASTTWVTLSLSYITSEKGKSISYLRGAYSSASGTPYYYIRLDDAQLEKDNIKTDYTNNDNFFKIK